MSSNDLALATAGTIGDLFDTDAAADALGLDPAADIDDLFDPAEDPDPGDVSDIDGLTDDELRARLVKAEKKARFETDLRLTTARKNWEQEARQHFPYSQPDRIKATSRRAFLEAAKEQDTEFRTRAKPLLDRVGETEDQVRARVEAEVEERYRNGWGTPTFSAVGGAPDESETDAKIDKARRRGQAGMKDSVKALIDGGRI